MSKTDKNEWNWPVPNVTTRPAQVYCTAILGRVIAIERVSNGKDGIGDHAVIY